TPSKMDGAMCQVGECSQPGICTAGACTGASPRPDGTPCSGGTCAGAMCVPAADPCSSRPDRTACSDGNACTQTDECFGGKCIGGNPVACVAMDSCHDVGVCNPLTGTCTSPIKMDGATCKAGECSHPGTCLAGACTGTTPLPDGT